MLIGNAMMHNFWQEDEWRDRDRYKKGRILGDIIEDIINIFLL